jgi:GTP-binding protein
VHFVDQARILVRGGSGGNGAVAFRREKFVPKGGPSGGDGGEGASVIFEVDEGLSTLLDFRYRREYSAPNGDSGANKDKYGRGGEDVILHVPGGTQVFDEASGVLLADLRKHGERFVAAKGGRGGRGNIHFATSTDRAPRRAEPGLPGEERELRLELKLLADVGLLGFPNVGKSSFIARVSAARPKIADYPFTTLVPNLGMVGLSDERSFVVADVPGLIEGAHSGAGLGDRFLRHLERTRVLVHLLEVSVVPGRTPLKDYDAINRELALFDSALAARPQLVILNKIDDPETQAKLPALKRAFARRKIRLLATSTVTGEGIAEVLEAAWGILRGLVPKEEDEAEDVGKDSLPRKAPRSRRPESLARPAAVPTKSVAKPAKPAKPVAKLAKPVAKPAKPVAKPAKPVAKLAKPVAKLAKPSVRRPRG